MTRVALVLLTGALAIAAAGCGATAQGTGPVQPAAAQTAGAAVTVKTFQFQPGELTVRAGTRVTWTNEDAIAHTVTSGTPESPDRRFDAPLDGKGAKFSYTFSQPGTYPYFCNRHQSMRGQIRVN